MAEDTEITKEGIPKTYRAECTSCGYTTDIPTMGTNPDCVKCGGSNWSAI